jgi:hypothetical protein
MEATRNVFMFPDRNKNYKGVIGTVSPELSSWRILRDDCTGTPLVLFTPTKLTTRPDYGLDLEFYILLAEVLTAFNIISKFCVWVQDTALWSNHSHRLAANSLILLQQQETNRRLNPRTSSLLTNLTCNMYCTQEVHLIISIEFRYMQPSQAASGRGASRRRENRLRKLLPNKQIWFSLKKRRSNGKRQGFPPLEV